MAAAGCIDGPPPWPRRLERGDLHARLDLGTRCDRSRMQQREQDAPMHAPGLRTRSDFGVVQLHGLASACQPSVDLDHRCGPRPQVVGDPEQTSHLLAERLQQEARTHGRQVLLQHCDPPTIAGEQRRGGQTTDAAADNACAALRHRLEGIPRERKTRPFCLDTRSDCWVRTRSTRRIPRGDCRFWSTLYVEGVSDPLENWEFP